MGWNEFKRLVVDRMPLIYVFMSGIGFSVQTLMIKLLAERGFRGAYHCVFSRGVVQLVIASLFMLAESKGRKPNEESPSLFGDTNYVRTIMVLRSIVGYFSIQFSFLSAEYISIGDSTVLVMMSPIVAAIASFFILGEPWYLPEFIGTILSIAGAIMVAKPPLIFGSSVDTGTDDPKQFYLGVIISLSAAVCAGFAFVLVRMLGTSAKMPWSNVCFVQALGQMFLSIPSLYIAGQPLLLPVTPIELVMIFVVGFVGAWSQIAMTLGMQREKSAAASAMRMSDVVFGFIWQVLFTADKLNMLSLFGAILVGSSILVIVVFKGNNASRNEENKSQPLGDQQVREYEVVSALEVDDEDNDPDDDIITDVDDTDFQQGKRRRIHRIQPATWFNKAGAKFTLRNFISQSIRRTLGTRRLPMASNAKAGVQEDDDDDDDDEEEEDFVEIELR